MSAAATTLDAALGAYHNGVGTVDAAIAAESGLLDAREAHAAALTSVVSLAFVVGSLTSRENVP